MLEKRYFNIFSSVDDNRIVLHSPIEVGTKGFEIRFLIKTSDTAGTILSGASRSSDGIYIDVNSGSLRAFKYSGDVLDSILISSASVADSTFHTVILVHDGDIASLIIDSVIVDSAEWELSGSENVAYWLHRPQSLDLFGIVANTEIWIDGTSENGIKVFDAPIAENLSNESSIITNLVGTDATLLNPQGIVSSLYSRVFGGPWLLGEIIPNAEVNTLVVPGCVNQNRVASFYRNALCIPVEVRKNEN